MRNAPQPFATRLLDWFDHHGRHDLPWQKNRTLYRVWVSEIMLQQTQVTTVIPYFTRFMQRFPNLKQLAGAEQDEVLEHWAGLGYYSRGRNLHKAARQIVNDHAGRMPRHIDALVALPGIGRSTAAAILSQALDQRHAILDGNVKRVLTRYHAIDGWPGERAVEERLWQLAESLTPDARNADYTQAIMDLGATLCRRSRPDCEACPVRSGCRARERDEVTKYPASKPKRDKPVRSARLLVLIDDDGAVMLEKRPASGIWGGLWSLPELATEADVEEVCRQRWGFELQRRTDEPVFRHSFSHYHLDIHPSLCELGQGAQVSDSAGIMWQPKGGSLPAVAAPVSRILERVVND